MKYANGHFTLFLVVPLMTSTALGIEYAWYQYMKKQLIYNVFYTLTPSHPHTLTRDETNARR